VEIYCFIKSGERLVLPVSAKKRALLTKPLHIYNVWSYLVSFDFPPVLLHLILYIFLTVNV
jgi:hypothetical protein